MYTFTYTSRKYEKTRTIALEVENCMKARLAGESWNSIGNASTDDEKGTRSVRFGSQCNVFNLADARCSPEWAEAVDRFAEEGGHDVEKIRRMMILTPRDEPAPPTAPTTPQEAHTATLTASPAPIGGWVVCDGGAGVNLRAAVSIAIDREGVYVTMANDDHILLYGGEHVNAYYDWVMEEVLGLSEFDDPEDEAGEGETDEEE